MLLLALLLLAPSENFSAVLGQTLTPTPSPTQVPTAPPTERANADAVGLGAIFTIFMIVWIVFPAGAVLREYQQGKRLEAEKRKLVENDGEFDADKKRRLSSNQRDEKMEEDMIDSQLRAREIVKDLLKISMARIFEGVFSRNDSTAKKLEYEIEHQHPYVSLFMSQKVGTKRWIYCFKLLTNLSVAAVLLALFLDMHFPSNYGGCYNNQTEETCIGVKLHFDHEKVQCNWDGEVCSFDGSNRPYGHKGFIAILMITIALMAGVNLILDVMFKYIISAQAKGDTRDVSEDLTRDNLRLKFHKKVQAQLARLNQGIIRHRESLIGKDEHNELEEFDAQWGVHLSKDGNEELVWMDRIALDLYDVVKQSHDIQVKLQSKGEIQCGVHLLYLFALDLMGRKSPAGRIFANKADEGVKLSLGRVSATTKVFTVLAVLVADIMSGYYAWVFTQGKLANWVQFYISLVSVYAVVDLLFIEGSKVFWVDFMCPYLVAPDALHAETIILHTLDEICEDATKAAKEERYYKVRTQADGVFAEALGEEAADKTVGALLPGGASKFSTSDHMFVSTRVAKHFPGLFESAIVLSYNEALPFATALYWGKHIMRPRRTHRAVVPISQAGVGGRKLDKAEARQHSEGGVGLGVAPIDGVEMTIERQHIHSLQNLRMQGAKSDSTVGWVYRSVAWVLLEFAGVAPIEVQKFAAHLIQPCLMYAFVNIAYQIQAHIATGMYIVAVVMVIGFILMMLYFSHERALKEAELDHHHRIHHHDDDSDEEDVNGDALDGMESGMSETRGASPSKGASILSSTIRREQELVAPKLLSTAVNKFSKRGEKGFNVRAAVDPSMRAGAAGGGGRASVSFTASSKSPLELQLQARQEEEQKSAAAQMLVKQGLQKAREEAEAEKEEERERQNELMKRILKPNYKSSVVDADEDAPYESSRRAEKKIENRLGRMDSGKKPFNEAYSSKNLKSPFVSSPEPKASLAGLLSAHKISPSSKTGGNDKPIVYPSSRKR